MCLSPSHKGALDSLVYLKKTKTQNLERHGFHDLCVCFFVFLKDPLVNQAHGVENVMFYYCNISHCLILLKYQTVVEMFQSTSLTRRVFVDIRIGRVTVLYKAAFNHL